MFARCKCRSIKKPAGLDYKATGCQGNIMCGTLYHKTTAIPIFFRRMASFFGVSSARIDTGRHNSPLAGLNRGQAYPNTLKSGTGEATNEVLAGGPARSLNFLDIISDF